MTSNTSTSGPSMPAPGFSRQAVVDDGLAGPARDGAPFDLARNAQRDAIQTGDAHRVNGHGETAPVSPTGAGGEIRQEELDHRRYHDTHDDRSRIMHYTLQYVHWRNSESDSIILTGYSIPGRKETRKTFDLLAITQAGLSDGYSFAAQQAYDDIKARADHYVAFRRENQPRCESKVVFSEWQAKVDKEWNDLLSYLRSWTIIQEASPPSVNHRNGSLDETSVVYKRKLVRTETLSSASSHQSAASVSDVTLLQHNSASFSRFISSATSSGSSTPTGHVHALSSARPVAML